MGIIRDLSLFIGLAFAVAVMLQTVSCEEIDFVRNSGDNCDLRDLTSAIQSAVSKNTGKNKTYLFIIAVFLGKLRTLLSASG